MSLLSRSTEKASDEDSQLSKSVRSSNRIAIEGQFGLISQTVKDALFNRSQCTHDSDNKRVHEQIRNLDKLTSTTSINNEQPMQM